MANSDHAINHCGLTADVEQKMSKSDFTEAVMKRSGEIITAAQTGKPLPAHKLGGVELCALVVANHVIENGAAMVASDLDVDLARLKKLAASQHISSC